MKKQKWAVLFVTVLFFAMTLMCWAKPDGDYSVRERRPLAQMPELNTKNILSGKFMSEFEEYVLDQFPMRDGFMALYQKTSTTKDQNGLYLADGHIGSMQYPMDEAGMERAAGIFKQIQAEFAPDNNIYLAIIPDKNAFLGEENGYLAMDYEAFYEKMQTYEKNFINFSRIGCGSMLDIYVMFFNYIYQFSETFC